MIIDFHTHAFPHNLAERAISKLAAVAKMEPHTDGTIESLIKTMDDAGIDRSVVLNIATNPKQQDNVNTFAIELNKNPRIISFGSIHPDSDTKRETMIRLKNSKIRGIKLHPDYMETVIDDEKFDEIFALCCEFDMIVSIHAGFDVISPNFIHATPERILNVINKFPSLKLVAAHVGGNALWDDVEKFLVGKNVWLDTSLAKAFGMPIEQMNRIVKNHDPEKILFGSDMPWGSSKESIDYVNQLSISSEFKEKIFVNNALKLLS